MRIIYKYLFFVLILIIYQNLTQVYSQTLKEQIEQILYDSNKKLSELELKQDFDVFRTTLEEAHPSLYRYIDKSTLDTKFDSIYNSLSQPITEIRFYRSLTYLISEIQDGHTNIHPSIGFSNFLKSTAAFFPLYPTFIGDKAYIMINASNHTEIGIGSELICINNTSINEIKQKLYEYISADSDIESRKTWVLSQNFIEIYYYVFGEVPKFIIEYINPDETSSKKVVINALPLVYIKKNLKQNFRNQKSIRYYRKEFEDVLNPLRLDFVKNSPTAILTINQFVDDKKLPFSKFLKNSFELIGIKKCKNLIIDLRGNPGGAIAYSQLLYSYLTDKLFRVSDSLSWKLHKLTYQNYTSLALTELHALYSGAKKDSLGFYNIPYTQSFLKEKQIKKIKNRFEGKVYFLIDGGSYSATNLFLVLAHRDKRGIFIGEESGGNYRESTALIQKPIILVLPNSLIKVEIPWLRFLWAVSGNHVDKHGVIPEHAVIQEIRDMINGGDTVISYTLDLIEKH